MFSFLLPTDGSPSAMRALEYALQRQNQARNPYQFHLLNVQVPIASGNIQSYISSEQLQEYYQSEAETILRPAEATLSTAGITATRHIGVGDPAEVISQYAEKLACTEIILGSRGLGRFGGLLLGSVATKVVQLTLLPIVLIK